VTCPGAGHLLVETLAVRPDAQDHGIGARLLGIAEKAAIGAGLGEVRLYTNEAMSENLEVYPRHGYVESHRRVVDGFRRVFFAKTLGGPGGLTAG
jgi:GNAT superfamily N-acetyltransferase